jgi:hypothetical protein
MHAKLTKLIGNMERTPPQLLPRLAACCGYRLISLSKVRAVSFALHLELKW